VERALLLQKSARTSCGNSPLMVRACL
jgi:hypothetical protein